MNAEEQHNKPFKIKLHPLLDEKTLNAISDATLAAIDGQLYKEPPLQLTPDDIGKDIKGEGIYLGTYAPVDRDGVSLKKVFNIFAAPEDLPETMKYIDTVKYIAKLKKWHGHNGANYTTDKELYTALKDGTYKGSWIIPTSDILYGKDVDRKKTMPDNLSTHKDKGSFKGKFTTTAASIPGCPEWYWSSTEDRDSADKVNSTRLSLGLDCCFSKNDASFSCRPVRLVECKQL